jgi:hypothetical protein
MKKLIITQSQFVRLMENVKKLILDDKINPKDFILINKNRNGIK